MEYIRGTRTPVNIVRADVQSEMIMVPYLGSIGDQRLEPEAASGYDRANWFAANTMGAPATRKSRVSATGRAQVSASAPRGVDGATRDELWTDSYWTGYNVVTLPEQYTEEANDLSAIWQVQTAASKGLNSYTWDQVYVDQDTQSIWS
jgi:hypothetical protein